MIPTAAVDFEGAVELFDEDEAGHLVGEGEGRETPAPETFLEKGGLDSV